MEELPETARYLLKDPEGQKIASRIAKESRDWARRILRPIDLSAALLRILLDQGSPPHLEAESPTGSRARMFGTDQTFTKLSHSTSTTSKRITMAPKPPPGALLSFTASPTLFPFNVQVKDYLNSHPSKHHIVAATLVFSPSNSTHVLIVQRSATDYVPNLWEIPGGSCDPDESILAGAVRELWEESGLIATEVLRQVGESYEWVEEGTVWCKFSFEVEIEGVEVILDEEEHQAFHWVTEEECRKGEVVRDGKRIEIKWTNESQVAVILEGFRLRAAAQFAPQACLRGADVA
ncbi:hypothetical protein G7Y89_g1324 [Cudoniella acicularis]|uniref:Nudix hydrolase domain-containing protein n=1 Tax=Cudoniella acicularis TaxID=354080 RepID=A0A8H4W822_9HELO|nr:hypothetical protein G7Y89_g1324 [Cudoniella acicularis]